MFHTQWSWGMDLRKKYFTIPMVLKNLKKTDFGFQKKHRMWHFLKTVERKYVTQIRKGAFKNLKFPIGYFLSLIHILKPLRIGSLHQHTKNTTWEFEACFWKLFLQTKCTFRLIATSKNINVSSKHCIILGLAI